MFYFEWNGLNLLVFFFLEHLRALLMKPPPLAVGRAAIVPVLCVPVLCVPVLGAGNHP
jgi:hypothetical protein